MMKTIFIISFLFDLSMMVLGFYMARGPSVKFFSTKISEGKDMPAYSMPAERAVIASVNS